MADPGAGPPEQAFGVETIHLDLPPLAGALGQRLRDAGVPVTPERSAEFARALTLVRPESRRRLYWTARSIFVSDRSQAAAFDAVFRSVFGEQPPSEAPPPEDAETVPAPADERPAAEQRGSATETAAEQRQPSVASAPSRESDGDEEGSRARRAAGDGERGGTARAARASTRSSRASSRSSTG